LPLQESIVSELIKEGADQQKIVVGLQMSANTFSLISSESNKPFSKVSGPGVSHFTSILRAYSLDIHLYWAVKMLIFWLPGQI
jgi:hypothetical protein